MTGWDEVVSAALLGTERRPPPDPGEPIAALAPALAEREPEARLLAAAGVLGVYRAAGRLPEPAPEALPDPAPDETRRRCSPAATQRLAAILDGIGEVLPEWLAAANAAGLRAPEELLPELLEIGRRATELREPLEPVLGERGRWLARLEPDWAWVAGGDPAEEWASAEGEVRAAALRRLRRTDPDAARERLAEAWPGEAPDDRAGFVDALEIGLSAADEPFLESALRDRRKEVRGAAAELLARLPGGAVSARMGERLRGLVSVEGRVRRRLRVELPDWDDELGRDGIVKRAPAGTGERAWWLQQIVAAAPLALWDEELGLTPAAAASISVADGLEGPVRAGMQRAAIRQARADWAEPLLEAGGGVELLAVLPRERAERHASDRVARDEWDALTELETPWGAELSRAVVDRLAKHLHAYGAGARARWLATSVDPGVAEHAERTFERVDPGTPEGRVAREFLDLLTFRNDMLEELR